MVVLFLSGLLLLVFAAPASAHVEATSGPFRVSMGWADEPALSGSPNAVEVEVADASGDPVAAPAGALSVEVSTGGQATVRPLVPGETPGAYRAALVPTRPGTYAFHLSGTVRGRALDVRASCSERTFDCVTSPADLQFPAQEPSSGDVARKLDRALPRAERQADDSADSARTLATVALALAILALAGVLFVALRGRWRRD